MNENTPNDRLEEAIKALRLSQRKFAKEIGLSESAIGRYFKDKILPRKYAYKFEELGLNWYWYESGNGEMLLPKKDDNKIPPSVSDNESRYSSGKGNTKGFVEVVEQMIPTLTVKDIRKIYELTKPFAELLAEKEEV